VIDSTLTSWTYCWLSPLVSQFLRHTSLFSAVQFFLYAPYSTSVTPHRLLSVLEVTGLLLTYKVQ